MLFKIGRSEGSWYVEMMTDKEMKEFLAGEAIWEQYRFLDHWPEDPDELQKDGANIFVIIRGEVVAPKMVDVVKKFEMPAERRY